MAIDGHMKRWVVLGCALTLSGCLSRVQREAISFPAMPGQAVYHRVNAAALTPEQAIDELQAAEDACRKRGGPGDEPVVVGTPAFDRCMQSQGYIRAR